MRALLCLLLLCGSALAASAPAPRPVLPGMTPPDFTRPGFDGKAVKLSDYHGKVVLLDFWASWCAPCIEETPRLIALQKANAGKLQIIGISMDDEEKAARAMEKKFSYNYPLLMGDVGFAKLYGGVLGLPQIFLIGRDGKVIKSWRGEMKPGELESAVKAAVS